MVQIKQITKDALRRMEPAEGLILQGCGGDLTEWVDGINDLLTQEGILLSGTKFQSCATFSHKGVTCLLFPFSAEVQLDMGRLALWRLQTHSNFGGTWLSDFVANQPGGPVPGTREKPDCPLLGQDGNIFNLLGIAARTLRKNGMAAEAKTLCQRVSASGSYEEALSYNDCPEIRGLYEGYHFFDFTRIHSMVQKYEAGKEFPELLVANYDLFERERAKPRQMSLFDNEEPTSWKEEILT